MQCPTGRTYSQDTCSCVCITGDNCNRAQRFEASTCECVVGKWQSVTRDFKLTLSRANASAPAAWMIACRLIRLSTKQRVGANAFKRFHVMIPSRLILTSVYARAMTSHHVPAHKSVIACTSVSAPLTATIYRSGPIQHASAPVLLIYLDAQKVKCLA